MVIKKPTSTQKTAVKLEKSRNKGKVQVIPFSMKTLEASSSSRLRRNSPSINISIYTQNVSNVRLSKTPHRQETPKFDFNCKPMPSARNATNFQNYAHSKISNPPKIRIKSVQKSRNMQNVTAPITLMSPMSHKTFKDEKPILKFDLIHFDRMRSKKM